MTASAEEAFVISALFLAGAAGSALGVWVYHPPERTIIWFKRFGQGCLLIAVATALVGLGLLAANA